jgi:hypothetical protein
VLRPAAVRPGAPVHGCHGEHSQDADNAHGKQHHAICGDFGTTWSWKSCVPRGNWSTGKHYMGKKTKCLSVFLLEHVLVGLTFENLQLERYTGIREYFLLKNTIHHQH